MEKVKGIRIDFIEQELFNRIEIEWLEALDRGEIAMSSIESHEDLEKLLEFLYHLQKTNSIFFKTLSNLGLIEEVETERMSRFEKSIRTIAERDAIDRTLGLIKGSSSRLWSFLSYADPIEVGSRVTAKSSIKPFKAWQEGGCIVREKAQKLRIWHENARM